MCAPACWLRRRSGGPGSARTGAMSTGRHPTGWPTSMEAARSIRTWSPSRLSEFDSPLRSVLPYGPKKSGTFKVCHRDGEHYMNLYEQLLVVRERLENIGAHDDSMDLVEKLLKKSEAARNDRTNISQMQVLRHMMRMPEVNDNYNIYNDLQELASERDEIDIASREDAAPAAYEETERRPKPKSF